MEFKIGDKVKFDYFVKTTNDRELLEEYEDNNYLTIIQIKDDNLVVLMNNKGRTKNVNANYLEKYNEWEPDRRPVSEFRDSGLLWFINTTLHMFGWAIVVDLDTDLCYPARVKYRGFDQKNNSKGYIKVSQYLKDNIDKLLEESKE